MSRGPLASTVGPAGSVTGRGALVVWRCLAVVLAALVLGFLTVPTGADAAPTPKPKDQLIVYTSYGAQGASVVGHAYVDIVDRNHPNCKPACHHIWGKYPGGNWLFDTDGDIKADHNTGWSWRITYPLTPAQYTDAFRFLEAQQKNPSRYQFLSANCMAWAAEVAAKAGQFVPLYTNVAGVPEPGVFKTQLERYGNGAHVRGGIVTQNQRPGTSSGGAPDPPSPTPPCCDVNAVMAAAMSEPQALAQQLGLQFKTQQLAPDQANADGTYRVVIDRTDPSRNVYGIAWGDGATSMGERSHTVAAQTVAFSHTYSDPPTAPVRVFILEDGALHEFVRSLAGPSSGTGHAERVVEPSAPPQIQY